MSVQAQIMRKCLEGSGRKRIKEMDYEDKIYILLCSLVLFFNCLIFSYFSCFYFCSFV